MTTLEEANEKIKTCGIFTTEDLEELQYRVEASIEGLEDPEEIEECQIDLYSALQDFEDLNRNYLDPRAGSTAEEKKQIRAFLRRLMAFNILVGIYKPITEEKYKDLDMPRKSELCPVIKGQRYEFDGHPVGYDGQTMQS